MMRIGTRKVVCSGAIVLATVVSLAAVGPAAARALPPPAPCPGCWDPTPTTEPWQIQLQGEIDLAVPAPVYDFDGLDNDAVLVDGVHAQGARAICYFSAGSYEPWRRDAGDFPRKVLGGPIEGFEEERWLDIRKLALLKPIMIGRMQECRDKGFDAVDPDNMDAYQNDTGLPLRGRHQLRYNAWVANAAHALGLAVGLKNDLGQVRQLVDYFDFQVNEQCYEYDECERLMPFINAGKPVYGIEYRTPLSKFCADSVARGFSTIRKTLALKAPRQTCPPG